ADARVVRSRARRLGGRRAHAPHSGETPLLVTGAVRAQIATLGETHMSRPSGPLDRAATVAQRQRIAMHRDTAGLRAARAAAARRRATVAGRSEEHTSELQSRENLVCRLLLEKKNRIHGPP